VHDCSCFEKNGGKLGILEVLSSRQKYNFGRERSMVTGKKAAAVLLAYVLVYPRKD
jgi:hypothetical protein